MLIPLGVLAASGGGVPPAEPAYELIESAILTSGQTSITFSGLSAYASTYKHFQIRLVNFSNQANLCSIRINGNTTSTARAHWLRADGSSVLSQQDGQTTVGMPIYNWLSGSTTNPAFAVIDILDAYSTTKNKTIKTWTGTNTQLWLFSGFWINTDAISSITLPHPNGFDFNAGSRFSLYGIRG